MGINEMKLGLENNTPIKLNKFQLTDLIRKLKSNSTINYMGIYSKEDKRKVSKMVDDNFRKSEDMGIILFYEK